MFTPGLPKPFISLIASTAIYLFAGGVTADDVSDFYASDVAQHVEPCLACHTEGGVAPGSGARLILSVDGASQDQTNARAFQDYYNLSDVDDALVLAKISGGAGHGGGRVHAVDSSGYWAIEDLLLYISGQNAGNGGGDSDDFWRGLVREPRERTLRRAAILFAGKLPSNKQLNYASQSDANLRATVLKFMKGDEFHKFLITGANDRLHTNAFIDGMNFEFDAYGYYPAINKLHSGLALDCLREEDEYTQFNTLHRCNQDRMHTFGLARAPLELIAKVVESGQSYKKVITAKFTMVNDMTNVTYRSGDKLPEPSQARGKFDPADSLIFKKGVNRGQVAQGDDLEFDDCPNGFCTITRHGDYIKQRHAGILTEPAWLARYPTTDTNRNRARARWTFYHFLGIDIEKSAPRTTDPVALADTDNPTLKNPACVVCHQRMDPVAGAYQNFGDFGIFRERWGGMDSLADTYKHPEWFGGEMGDTPYIEGDTWYRDMRKPGINGKTTAKKNGSLQWLAAQIVEDPRFAKAAVTFWWPAIMGAEVLEAPEVETDPDYSQKLNAYNAQQALMNELAEDFRAGSFKAKKLFADMVMSDWFRAEGFDSEDLEERLVELATVGSGRLLTPEELDRKTYAIFGARWNQSNVDPWNPEGWTQLSKGDERIAYGGIDSVGILERSRSMTALMSNVAERQSIEFACRAVTFDFNRDRLPAIRKKCSQDLWYETDWEKRNCNLAMPEQRPALFSFVTINDLPNDAGKAKIEKQLKQLYEVVLGKPLKSSDPDYKELYDILESSWQETKQRGWVDNPCWLGSELINEWTWDQQYDPNGMVAAWGAVLRALMTHYWYLHD